MYGKVCKYEAARVSRLWHFQCCPKLCESEEEIEGSPLECSPAGKKVPTPGGSGYSSSGGQWAGSF